SRPFTTETQRHRGSTEKPGNEKRRTENREVILCEFSVPLCLCGFLSYAPVRFASLASVDAGCFARPGRSGRVGACALARRRLVLPQRPSLRTVPRANPAP